MSENNGDTTMIDPSKETRIVKGVQQNKFFSFVPQNWQEAKEFAQEMCKSMLVPKAYFGKREDCLIAMQWGGELGMAPMQAVQNIAVINNKPGLYGDIGKALLQSRGFRIEERDMKETKAKSEAWCRITRPDNGQVTERTFSIDNAKDAKLWGREGPWTTYPYRQMAWRAFWYAARDAASDVLKGLSGAEELLDVVETTATIESDSGPREIQPQAAQEPTPENPVVDAKAPAQPAVDCIGPDERKHLVALLAKHNINPEILKDHLQEKYGITDDKTPTKHIPKAAYKEVCSWIEDPQAELGV